MFGFFKKNKIKKSEELLNKMLFITKVSELREKAGFEKSNLPIENLILFFSMNLADLVFQQAKKSPNPELDSDPSEKAATLVIFAQAVHMGSRMTNINDSNLKSIIMQNGMAMLLQTDIDHPEPQAQAEMSLATTTYQSLSSGRIEILQKIDNLTHEFLVNESQSVLLALVQLWNEIVIYISGSHAKIA